MSNIVDERYGCNLIILYAASNPFGKERGWDRDIDRGREMSPRQRRGLPLTSPSFFLDMSLPFLAVLLFILTWFHLTYIFGGGTISLPSALLKSLLAVCSSQHPLSPLLPLRASPLPGYKLKEGDKDIPLSCRGDRGLLSPPTVTPCCLWADHSDFSR